MCYTKNKLCSSFQVDIEVGNNISRMRHNPHQMHQVGTGGKENDLKIWDLNSPEEPVFKAKNVNNVKFINS